MPEYTYLLDTRLSEAQRNALAQVRDAARSSGMTVFLAGGAVRDLTTGSSVRDLDFSVQGNALDLERAITERGGVLWGRHEASRTLFFWFPGSVRVEVAATRSESFPKPGQPRYSWSGIVDDLHRRDFTANAMALSLNEGSYGLLLDPLNGVADIEARQLRLVSNYGFLEDPSRLVRAIRLSHRLGWSLEEKTRTRYENAKEADNFEVVSPFLRGYELEEIASEEDALPVLRQLEAEGWMSKLGAAWTSDKADTAALENLHRNRIQLLLQGVTADLTAAHLEVLTAGMTAGDREALTAVLPRPGLQAQWKGLDAAAKEFARKLTSKEAAAPSASWKLFHSEPGEAILWLAHTRKNAAVEQKFKNFFTVWPEAAKKVPVALMLEMRITPELPIYGELLHELFLQQIDGKLDTDEQMRAFLEAYSPPAPPPPVTLRRSRSKKGDGKSKRKGAARDADDDEDETSTARADDDEDEDEEDAPGGLDLVPDGDDLSEDEDEDDEEEKELEEQPGSLSIALGGKLNLDKVDLEKVDLPAVLGRIIGEDADLEEVEEPEAGTEISVEEDEAELPSPSVPAAAPPAKPAAPAKASKDVRRGGVGVPPAVTETAETLPKIPTAKPAVAESKKAEANPPAAKRPAPAAEKAGAKGTAASAKKAAAPPKVTAAAKPPAKKVAAPVKVSAPTKASAKKSPPPVKKAAPAAKKAAPVQTKAVPGKGKPAAGKAPAKSTPKPARKR